MKSPACTSWASPARQGTETASATKQKRWLARGPVLIACWSGRDGAAEAGHAVRKRVPDVELEVPAVAERERLLRADGSRPLLEDGGESAGGVGAPPEGAGGVLEARPFRQVVLVVVLVEPVVRPFEEPGDHVRDAVGAVPQGAEGAHRRVLGVDGGAQVGMVGGRHVV